ncbi:MAG TPA: hypothetical protein VK724_20970 [Bryobacteraceae bacterium]|jgi:hypothetical protein|nr:hypothetical protein [Bryobacteraceae bacterium]
MPKILRAVLLLGAILPAILSAQSVYRTRRGAPGTPVPPAYKDVAGSFHGKLKQLTKKDIMIETEDEQTVSMRVSGKTKYYKGNEPIKATDIDIETPVTVDASEDSDLKFTAINVIVDVPKKNDDAK